MLMNLKVIYAQRVTQHLIINMLLLFCYIIYYFVTHNYFVSSLSQPDKCARILISSTETVEIKPNYNFIHQNLLI